MLCCETPSQPCETCDTIPCLPRLTSSTKENHRELWRLVLRKRARAYRRKETSHDRGRPHCRRQHGEVFRYGTWLGDLPTCADSGRTHTASPREPDGGPVTALAASLPERRVTVSNNGGQGGGRRSPLRPYPVRVFCFLSSVRRVPCTQEVEVREDGQGNRCGAACGAHAPCMTRCAGWRCRKRHPTELCGSQSIFL